MWKSDRGLAHFFSMKVARNLMCVRSEVHDLDGRLTRAISASAPMQERHPEAETVKGCTQISEEPKKEGKGPFQPFALCPLLSALYCGLPNLESGMSTLTLMSFSVALKRPSSHENLYANGNLMPFTSR